MRLLEVRSATRCAVCHDDLSGVAVACAGCGARAHLDCWTELGRCTSLGCGVRPRITLGPAAPVRRRRPLAGLLLVSLALLGLVTTVAWINLQGQRRPDRGRRLRGDMRAIGYALDLYKVDVGHYPATLDALWQRPVDAKKWGPEPYLKEYPPKDPWANEYLYRYELGARPEIISLGEDGERACSCRDQDYSSRTINER